MKIVRLSTYINSSSSSTKVLGKAFVFPILLLLLSTHLSWSRSFNIPVAKIRSNPTKLYDLKHNIKLIDKEELMDMLKAFVKYSRPSRLVGTPGHKQAQEFILKTLSDIDPDKNNLKYVDHFNPDVDSAKKMYWDDFNSQIKGSFKPTDENYKKWLDFTKSTTSFLESKKAIKGQNIIWEKRGGQRPEEILVIGAHYDTIVTDTKTMVIQEGVSMPGANDNGSGVTIALALVQLLSKLELPITIRVVFFDWGELGFLGSKAFASKYKSEFKDKKFLGLVNLDMLGHDSKFLDKEKKFQNMKIYIRRPGDSGYMDDNRLAKRLVDLGDRISPSVEFNIEANQFKNSDNVSLWREGLSSITFSGDWENDFNKKHYHSSGDLVEIINIRTFHRSYEFIVGSIMGMAFDIKQ